MNSGINIKKKNWGKKKGECYLKELAYMAEYKTNYGMGNDEWAIKLKIDNYYYHFCFPNKDNIKKGALWMAESDKSYIYSCVFFSSNKCLILLYLES